MRRALAGLALLLALQAPAQTVVVYSRVDSTQAHRAHQLASALGPALIDRTLQPGTPWRPTISRWICGADLVLVVANAIGWPATIKALFGLAK